MLLTNLLLLVPLVFALPSPSIWRQTPQCSIDLAQLADDLGNAAVALWGDNDLPFPTDPEKLTSMHDEFIFHLKPKYPDPCQQEALVVEIGAFFTSGNLNAIDARDISPSTDLQLYEPLTARGGLKISCRKCKKLYRQIVGIVAPIVCTKVAVAAGTATANPAVGDIAGYLCLDAARQFEEKGKVELRVADLRRAGGGRASKHLQVNDH